MLWPWIRGTTVSGFIHLFLFRLLLTAPEQSLLFQLVLSRVIRRDAALEQAREVYQQPVSRLPMRDSFKRSGSKRSGDSFSTTQQMQSLTQGRPSYR